MTGRRGKNVTHPAQRRAAASIERTGDGPARAPGSAAGDVGQALAGAGLLVVAAHHVAAPGLRHLDREAAGVDVGDVAAEQVPVPEAVDDLVHLVTVLGGPSAPVAGDQPAVALDVHPG